MARGEASHESPHEAGTHVSRASGGLEAPTPGPASRDRMDALRDVLAAATDNGDPLEPHPPRSRRRPRRADVVTYRIRIDLEGTSPPLWRRLELSSDLFLDAVHDVVQVAFGWTNSHLHRFGSGPTFYSHDTEYYLGPGDIHEGEPEIPEQDVRLDEVLVDVGDRLLYTYDFGDDWQHTIALEAVLPRQESAPRAVCTAGERPGPPEDCGGVYGYELIAAAIDPGDPGATVAAIEFDGFDDDDAEPAISSVTPFDIAEINRGLTGLALEHSPTATDPPQGPLADLVDAVQLTTARRRLQQLIGQARLDEEVDVDATTAARMVHPYAWLLDRVGDAGIRLTSAGYLPPAHAEAAAAELGLEDEWIGRGDRESRMLPVLHLRQSARRMGLLRKHRGTLAPTARGRAVRHDPVALWWHVAERMPLRSRDACEWEAGLILLVAVAAPSPDELHPTVAGFLDAIGWVGGDGGPLTDLMVARATLGTKSVLRRLGALAAEPSDDGGFVRRENPTADGVGFARAALRTWPSRP